MNAFERWLIRQRHFCEIGSCIRLAERVIEVKGRHKVVCGAHWRAYAPLEAGLELRREIESKQYIKEKNV